MAGWTCACGASRLQGTWCAWCGRWAWWFTPTGAAARSLRRRGLDARGRVLAVLIAVLVVSGFGRVGAVASAERRARNAALAAAVDEVTAFIADLHGAPFDGPVRVRLLDDDAFDDAYYGDYTDEEDADPADFSATMLALGLADPDEESGEDDGGGDALGFYDSGADVLYVRGLEITPFTKMVLVHELTHAWQDQHYDLSALQDSAEDADHFAAIEALVEGDAMRVENAWRAAQSEADRAAIDARENVLDPSGGPELTRAERVWDALSSFPYVAGEHFATAVHAQGGNAALTNAFHSPPRSTEQVLNPARYFAEQEPVQAPEPDADGRLLDHGVLGQLGLALVVARGDIDADAVRATAGWEGDAYVTWQSSRGTCTEATVLTDSSASRDRLAAALRAGAGREVTKAGAKRVDFRYCAA